MTLSSVNGFVLVCTDDNGNTLTRVVQKDASVSINGKASALADLRSGDKITVSGEPAASVNAIR